MQMPSNMFVWPEVRLTSRLSGVRRTVTPASTLPTVKETSIVSCFVRLAVSSLTLISDSF